MVCSRVTEAGVSKYKDNYTGSLTLDLVVVNGSMDTAEVLRQVAGKIRCASVRAWVGDFSCVGLIPPPLPL